PACATPAEQSDDPRKRRRCSAWRYSAVYTEWCRSLGALPVPNAGQWLGSTPAGCEVCRGSPAENESPTLDRDLPKSALDGEEKPCHLGPVHTWHKAEIERPLLFVRFWGKADISLPLLRVPSSRMSDPSSSRSASLVSKFPRLMMASRRIPW